MKQIVQNLKTGVIYLEEIPAPMAKPGHLVIKTSMTLVSAGTERMLVEFGRANLIEKIRQQPEKVSVVLDKIKSDGLFATMKAVRHQLDQPMAMGYCNVGVVSEVGEGIEDIRVGDRVVSNGPHAELVSVPRNLVALVPTAVHDENAVFTIPAAIALNAVRRLNPQLGETVVVIGLGLIGLLTAQLLRINGCEVIGVDIDEKKLEIASSLGLKVCSAKASGVPQFVASRTANAGADGVIIATATSDNDIIKNAARVCRRRGTIVLVGTAGLNIPRQIFFEKEITFYVSRSYGPGRYDPEYETKGTDYPRAYVRWTANRNFQAALALLASGALDVSVFKRTTKALDEFENVYNTLTRGNADIILFRYNLHVNDQKTSSYRSSASNPAVGSIAVIGAGNYVKSTLLPILKRQNISYIGSTGGLSGAFLAKKYNIPHHTTDFQIPLGDPEVSLVMICTQHDSHAQMAVAGLRAEKHVFVEKPLAIFEKELSDVINAFIESDPERTSLTVGFNRRFSPYTQKMKSLSHGATVNVVITVNAGPLPETSWLFDRTTGGGRIIGEMCHFLDLIGFLAGSPISAVCANAMRDQRSHNTDNVIVSVKCQNGAIGTINYFSNGSKAYGKERIEMYFHEKTLVLDNFQLLRGYGFSNFSNMYSGHDKGHTAQFSLLTERIQRGGRPLISFEEIVNTTQATFATLQSLKHESWINL
jgi:predicted dehydrogenase/threonine dehydrogenase-like Zn-dependent dehydrogenase